MRRKVIVLFALFLLYLPALPAQQPAPAQTPAAAQAEVKSEEGEINGAHFRIEVPAGWDHGGLVVYCHGYEVPAVKRSFADSPNMRALRNVFLSRGFAFIMSAYAAQGWAVKEALEDTEELRRYFVGKYGQPREAYVTGHSMGGMLTVAALERYPTIYTAGLPICGPLSPALDFMNSRVFDMVITFDYFFPGVLGPLDEIRPADLQPKIREAIKASPEKAELLARRFDIDTASLPGVVNFFRSIVWELRQRAGGNPFDNRNTVYIGYGDDAALNRGVKRFAADPRAQAYLREYYTPTGHISVPVLTIHTTFDPLVPARDVNYYNVTTKIAGTQSLFVEKFVEARGHCAVNAAQTGAGFDALLSWVHDGKKPAPGEIK